MCVFESLPGVTCNSEHLVEVSTRLLCSAVVEALGFVALLSSSLKEEILQTGGQNPSSHAAAPTND